MTLVFIKNTILQLFLEIILIFSNFRLFWQFCKLKLIQWRIHQERWNNFFTLFYIIRLKRYNNNCPHYNKQEKVDNAIKNLRVSVINTVLLKLKALALVCMWSICGQHDMSTIIKNNIGTRSWNYLLRRTPTFFEAGAF